MPAIIGTNSAETRPGPRSLKHRRLIGDGRDAAAAGVDDRGDQLGISLRQIEAGVGHGEAAGGDGELGEARHAAGGLGVHKVGGIELGDVGGDLHLKSGLGEGGHAAHA